MKRREYTYIDLFSGAGGLSVGFRAAGFRSVFAVEIEEPEAATYRRNFGNHVFCGPIEELEEIPVTADIVIGGPPCQGFSPLGKMSPRIEHRKMNTLWRHFMRIVEQTNASAFLIENVPQILRSEQFPKIQKEAERLGFQIVYDVLKAEEYGVPQARRRAFILGLRGATPRLPEPTEERMTVWDAIGDLPLEPDDRNWHIGRNPTATSLERYKVIPPGGNRFDLMRERPDITPQCWLNKPTGSTDVFGRLEWDKPSLTIRTEFFKPEKGRYLHPQVDRPITHREAARLQTFPDDFIFEGSKTQVARQIGNAVPPKLAQAIARALREQLVDLRHEDVGNDVVVEAVAGG